MVGVHRVSPSRDQFVFVSVCFGNAKKPGPTIGIPGGIAIMPGKSEPLYVEAIEALTGGDPEDEDPVRWEYGMADFEPAMRTILALCIETLFGCLFHIGKCCKDYLSGAVIVLWRLYYV